MKTVLSFEKLFFMSAIMLTSWQVNAQIQNTRYGTDALPNNNGVNNTAFGHAALKFNDYTGRNNVAIGAFALADNLSGKENTAVGDNAMLKNDGGSNNTAIGHRVLFWNDLGEFNTASGDHAMYNNTTGKNNSAYGVRSLYYNANGFGNSAFGLESMYYNYVGFNNSAFGIESLRANNAGLNNSAFGAKALRSNSRGQDNTAMGFNAHYGNTDGNSNIAIGASTLYYSTTGNHNTVVGSYSGGGIVSGSRNTIIGANVAGLPSSLSNTIIIADGSGNQRLYIDNNGKTRIGDPSLTMPGTYRLYVKEGILTEKVVIAVANSAQWADYVFAPDYKLMPLTEVAEFVKENAHLPNVPSANDIVKNGINLGQMDAKLLEKIEELTLYAIEQNAKYEALVKEFSELKHRMETVERRSKPCK
jgi:trimeric autotransporter adhesin